jgi:hypothetical protein
VIPEQSQESEFVRRTSTTKIEDTTVQEDSTLTFVDILEESSTRDVLSCTGSIDYYQIKKPIDIHTGSIDCLLLEPKDFDVFPSRSTLLKELVGTIDIVLIPIGKLRTTSDRHTEADPLPIAIILRSHTGSTSY